jgi:hypothetical protein
MPGPFMGRSTFTQPSTRGAALINKPTHVRARHFVHGGSLVGLGVNPRRFVPDLLHVFNVRAGIHLRRAISPAFTA